MWKTSIHRLPPVAPGLKISCTQIGDQTTAQVFTLTGNQTSNLSVARVPNLLLSLGHTGRRGVVLGHTLNTLRHIITKKSSHNVLRKFMFFVLGCIPRHPQLHAACRLQGGHPVGWCSNQLSHTSQGWAFSFERHGMVPSFIKLTVQWDECTVNNNDNYFLIYHIVGRDKNVAESRKSAGFTSIKCSKCPLPF